MPVRSILREHRLSRYGCWTMSNRAAATFYYYFSYWTLSGSYRRARTK